jgi:hypothetical protein
VYDPLGGGFLVNDASEDKDKKMLFSMEECNLEWIPIRIFLLSAFYFLLSHIRHLCTKHTLYEERQSSKLQGVQVPSPIRQFNRLE